MRYAIHGYNINTRKPRDFCIAKVTNFYDAYLICMSFAEAVNDTLCIMDSNNTVRAVYEAGVGFTDPDCEDLDPYDGVPADTGSV